jgi:RNA-directed DNA polymerase
MHENRETSVVPADSAGRTAKAQSHKAGMHAREESDRGVVPMNQPNKGVQAPAEVGEGRPRPKENTGQSHTPPAQNGQRVSQGLIGVRRAARERKQERFTTLLHHLNVDLLRGSYYALQRKAAPGVDGMTWREYADGLEDRLTDLHSRIHRGAYRAQPSRRVYIPKADGKQRPLGIASLEDKIVQQAVVTILNQIYEVDFRGFSYGFRPGRDPHQALDALNVGISRRRVNWILDADIKGFFDHVSHEWLEKFLKHRIADNRVLRLIQKWMKAGVLEDGERLKTEQGTPQGAVMTPRTQKITSSLSVGWSFGGNRVRIDVCRMRLYGYGRCHAPARPRKPSASIARATCCCVSSISPMRSSSWPRTARFHRVKLIATSNKLSG